MAANKLCVPALAVLLMPALLLSGCVAKTVAGVVTAPVKVASKTVDLATTSQSEADEKRGRELRKREERLGKLEQDYKRHYRECQQGDAKACALADEEYAEIQEILPAVPAGPR